MLARDDPRHTFLGVPPIVVCMTGARHPRQCLDMDNASAMHMRSNLAAGAEGEQGTSIPPSDVVTLAPGTDDVREGKAGIAPHEVEP
jgi:hypothetical protein